MINKELESCCCISYKKGVFPCLCSCHDHTPIKYVSYDMLRGVPLWLLRLVACFVSLAAIGVLIDIIKNI